MAPNEDPEAPSSRIGLLIGLVVAGLASTAAFGRVYQGGDVTLRLCAISLGATALAALMLRRGVLLATVASAALLLITIGLVLFPETTRYALPTLRTMRAIGTSLHRVGRDANITVAPAPPVSSLMLAGLTAVWTAAFAAHSLAFRARSPLLALTPLVALLAFAGIVVEDGARPVYVLVFMFGALLLLFADAVRRLGQWGPISAWHGRRRLTARSGATTRGAWRVAVGTLGVALFVPWLLPGFGSQALLYIGNGPAKGFSLNPIDDIRTRLVSNPDVVAFTVHANHPTYWRQNTLDLFNGVEWTWSTPPDQRAGPVVDGTIATQGDAGAATSSDVVVVTQAIRFENLSQPWLPVAASPTTARISQGDLQYDAASGALLSSDFTSSGEELTVRSEVVVPTPAELDAVANMNTTAGDPDVQLPSDLPGQIRALARLWAASETTPYRKIMAIQEQLKAWTYDLHVPASTSNDALLKFLFETHRGYCQQYAGAMAVLLRTLGYPTRVAVGFTPGTYEAKNAAWSVSGADAHAWVEVRFPGYGWLAFDPTPTRSNPRIARYDDPSAAPSDSGSSSKDKGSTTPIGRPGVGDLRLGQPKRFLDGPTQLPAGTGGRDWRPIAAAAGGGLVLATLILIPLAKLTRRRWSRKRNRAPAERVLAAYSATLAAAADVGLGRRRDETIQEYRARLKRSVEFRGDGFDALTALAERAAYSGGSIPPEDERLASVLSRRTSKEVRQSAGPWRSMVGAYRLGVTNDD